MTYAARGLPFGTGLTFTSSGSLSGTPKEEDYGLTEVGALKVHFSYF